MGRSQLISGVPVLVDKNTIFNFEFVGVSSAIRLLALVSLGFFVVLLDFLPILVKSGDKVAGGLHDGIA